VGGVPSAARCALRVAEDREIDVVDPRELRTTAGSGRQPVPARGHEPANLADILERVLDKGIVIAGDIQVNLLDIELLTIKLRLIVASVDRAKEMGINWWEHDPTLSSRDSEIEEENRLLRERISALEARDDRDALSPHRENRQVRRSREPIRRERGD